MKKLTLLLALWPSIAFAQLQIPYTAPISSTAFPNSVWIVSQTNLNDLKQTGQVCLNGYDTLADVGVTQPIDSKCYQITPANYAQFTGAVDHIAAGYALAQATQDIVTTAAIPATLDANGNILTPAVPAVKASTFAGATTVALNPANTAQPAPATGLSSLLR